MTLRTLKYGNYGIFLIMGSAGYCPSAVVEVMVLIICHGQDVGLGFYFRAFERKITDYKTLNP